MFDYIFVDSYRCWHPEFVYYTWVVTLIEVGILSSSMSFELNDRLFYLNLYIYVVIWNMKKNAWWWESLFLKTSSITFYPCSILSWHIHFHAHEHQNEENDFVYLKMRILMENMVYFLNVGIMWKQSNFIWKNDYFLGNNKIWKTIKFF